MCICKKEQTFKKKNTLLTTICAAILWSIVNYTSYTVLLSLIKVAEGC